MDNKEIICKCLRIIESGKEPKHSDFDIDNEQFGEIGEYIRDYGLATNISVSRGGRGNKVVMVFMKHSEVTNIGYRFLQQNEK